MRTGAIRTVRTPSLSLRYHSMDQAEGVVGESDHWRLIGGETYEGVP